MGIRLKIILVVKLISTYTQPPPSDSHVLKFELHVLASGSYSPARAGHALPSLVLHLWCCIFASSTFVSGVHPSFDAIVYLVLGFVFWTSLLFFFVFYRVFSTVCHYLSYMIWGELWNFYGYVLLLVLFGYVFVDIPSLTAFIGGQFSWSSYQESVDPHHSF